MWTSANRATARAALDGLPYKPRQCAALLRTLQSAGGRYVAQVSPSQIARIKAMGHEFLAEATDRTLDQEQVLLASAVSTTAVCALLIAQAARDVSCVAEDGDALLVGEALFRTSLRARCATFGATPLLAERKDCAAVEAQIWCQSMSLLPPLENPPAQNVDDDEMADDFEDPRERLRGVPEEGADPTELVWRFLTDERLGAFLSTCSTTSRALLLRATQVTAVSQAAVVTAKACRSHDAKLTPDRELLAAYCVLQQDDGDLNILRLTRRWVSLMTLGVLTLCSLNDVFEGLSASNAAADLFNPERPPSIDGLWVACNAVVDSAMANTDFGLSDGWSHVIPGVVPRTPVVEVVTPRSASSASVGGLRFLGDQLRLTESKYRMPKDSDEQRIWEAWFTKIQNLETMFKDLPPKLIIPSLTGHIQADDRRIYGWGEIEAELKGRGVTPTLAVFLQHVRNQVLSTSTWRRYARRELLELSEDYSHIPDCSSLSTKLKQLYAQLWPVSGANSEEPEPMTRHEAVKAIHKILARLPWGKYSGLSALVRGWKAFTIYNHAVVFTEHVDENLYKNVNADQAAVLAKAYLDHMCGSWRTLTECKCKRKNRVPEDREKREQRGL